MSDEQAYLRPDDVEPWQVAEGDQVVAQARDWFVAACESKRLHVTAVHEGDDGDDVACTCGPLCGSSELFDNVTRLSVEEAHILVLVMLHDEVLGRSDEVLGRGADDA